MSTTTAVKESEVEQIDHVLGEEYEHMPVPSQARRSLFSVTMVWIGFPMIITGAMTGSILVLGMGFQRALMAMIIGNMIMFAYVGVLGVLGTKKRHELRAASPASCSAARATCSRPACCPRCCSAGMRCRLASPGSDQLDLRPELCGDDVIAGLLYIAITFVGVRGLHYIGLVSVPLFVVLGVWVAVDSGRQCTAGTRSCLRGQQWRGDDVDGRRTDHRADAVRRRRNGDGRLQPLGQGFEKLADLDLQRLPVRQSGRHAGRRRHDGGARGAERQSVRCRQHVRLHERQADRLAVGARLHVPLLATSGSVCSHCLYNSATGWSRILGSQMRLLAIVLGVIGIMVAAGNVWAFFIQWLSLLGILVPPIGAIILVDQYLCGSNVGSSSDWRPRAFIAWMAGSVVAFLCESMRRNTQPRISAFLVAAVVYYCMYVKPSRDC